MMSLSSAECLGISPTASQENITNDILHTLMFPFYNSVAGVCWMLSVTHPMVNDIILGTDSAAKSLQSCPTLRDPMEQPTKLLRPWDFPGKSTGVGAIAFSYRLWVSLWTHQFVLHFQMFIFSFFLHLHLLPFKADPGHDLQPNFPSLSTFQY